MRKFFTFLARLLAFLCAIVFIATLVAALVLVNAENRLFKSETYKRALESTGMYDRLPALAAQQILSNLAGDPCQKNPFSCVPETATELRGCIQNALGAEAFSALSAGERQPTPEEQAAIQGCAEQFGPLTPPPSAEQAPGYLKYLTVKDWERLITTLVPPAQMREFTEQTLDQVFDFLNGKTDSVALSLAPLKERLGKNGAEAIKGILKAQPDCTTEQIATLTVKIIAGEKGLGDLMCNPPADILSQLTPLIDQGLQVELNTIPDSLPLLSKADQPDLMAALEFARLLMRLSPLVPLGFLLLMSLLAVRSLKSWLRWWGLSLIFAGAIGLLVALLNGPITRLILTIEAPHMPAYTTRLVEASLEVILAVAREVATPVAIESAVILAAGIAMTIFVSYVREQKA